MQSTLDLAPELSAFPALAPGASVTEPLQNIARRPAGTARALVTSRLADARLPGVETSWKLEPYRGATLEIRSSSRRRSSDPRKVQVTEGLADVVSAELDRRDRRRLEVAIGTRFEPYPAAELRFGVTRSVLEALEAGKGLGIKLTTRSPLVLRDQALLARLDMAHAVSVAVPIASLDKHLASCIEPNAPDPATRLEIVHRLSRDGIGVVVACDVFPGVNGSVDELEPLFAGARRAGAVDLVASLRRSPVDRPTTLQNWIESQFLRSGVGVSSRQSRDDGRSHLRTFDRLRLAHGFPVLRTGRG